jgi:Tol biopolymer transport system component/DNA-binding winged helix-turn-helix (wHTH) protein
MVRFDGFQLDLRAGELHPDGGKTLRLPEQPFLILTMFLERPGEVLTQEDIRKKLWPDNTNVAFEHSISAAMNRLRQALGDSADRPRYIETLARRGYRWMVSVEWVPAATPRRRWLPWAAALLIVISVSAGSVWVFHSAPKAPEPSLTVVPLSTYPGFQVHPSFSPDGNQVAFVWNGEKQDNFDIYVKVVNTVGAPLRLTNDPAADFSPAWSPDGGSIAFLRRISDDKCALLLIPALGGPQRKISEASCPFHFERLAWSPDGSSLAMSDRDSAKEPFALYLVSIESGEKRKLTSPSPPSVGDVSPAFSPDGGTLAFSRRVDWGFRSDLYLVPFSKTVGSIAEPKRVTFDNRGAMHPAWSADGSEIVFADSSGLWKMAVSAFTGKAAEPRRLSFAANGQNATVYEHSDPDISRRGRRLAYRHDLIHSSIGRIAAPILDKIPTAHERNNRKDLDNARFIASTRDDSQPQFSPDGKRIAFSSDRSGNLEIWVCDADGLNPVQLTFFRGAYVTTPRWSPDSRRIVFDSDAEGQFDVWIISANGGKPQRLTNHPANDGNPSWSRDGGWIYFDSARTGEQQVWKLPAGGGEPTQLTWDGGWAPLESPDGKFLYYVKDLQDTDLWRLSLKNGQPAKVLQGLSSYVNLAIVDTGIYFIPARKASEGSSIQFLQLPTNSIRTIVTLQKPLNFVEEGGIAVSPDGRSILYTQFDLAGSELMVVENFQ